ncbi:MAG: histidine phosphatase family protein [Alphaproteobacteria bacterium]|nr:histidine phosphatase family protein [Alphaproteobacteria bacterium]
MTKIILTRHGHVEGIDPPVFRGRAELTLTARGRADAAAVAARIATTWQPRRVYTSPMGRCVATGTSIADACKVESEVLPGLIDLDYGDWQGHSHDEIQAAAPELFAAWFDTPDQVRFPNGDSLHDLVARTADALRFVLEHAIEAEEPVVLVGHDSVNRALLIQLLDQPLSTYWRIAQAPCTINEIDIVDGRIRVLRINDTAHLEDFS